MADARRQWLQLQRDLGGDEVIFDQPTDVSAALGSPEKPVIKARAPAESAPVVEVEVTVPSTPARIVRPFGAPDAKWRKDAPPIPGPGMIVGPSPESVARGAGLLTLDAIAAEVAECRGCPLCTGRTNTVPGDGNPEARLMCVGEGPGEKEDLSGLPFVGRAGELLNNLLEGIEVPRPQVYIANVVKCRPPRNRVPLPDERAACLPYLHRQIALVRPKVLLALGGTAAESLLGVKKPLGDLRLRVHSWDGIPLIVTYHPAALLRNPNWKRPAWDDARIARQLLELDA